MELQPVKVVGEGYVVALADLGGTLLALGTVVFPFALQTGFYVTVINSRGGTVALQTPGATMRSPSSAASLATINSSTTVLRLPGNDWFAFGL